MGWSGGDLDAVLDLGEAVEVRRVGVDCLRAQGPWIFLPRQVEVSLSLDEEDWGPPRVVEIPLEEDSRKAVERITVDVSDAGGTQPARFLRIRARNRGRLPEWHPGYPESAWLFVDEIVVE